MPSRKTLTSSAILMVLIMAMCGCRSLRHKKNAAVPTEATIPGEFVPPPNAYGYLQNGPVVTGAQLVGAPQVTATERALQLRQEIDQMTAVKMQMENDVRQLQGDISLKHEAVKLAHNELAQAESDLQSTQRELQAWRSDMHNLHARLRTSEQKQIDALEGMVQLLSHVIEQHEPPISAAVPPQSAPEILPVPKRSE